MLRLISKALVALALLAGPLAAQTFTLPELGLQNSGACRQPAPRNRASGAMVALGCVDTTSSAWKPLGDGSRMSVPTSLPGGIAGTLGQINGATLNLAQDGTWGASQADNDRIFASALTYSSNPMLPPVTIDIPMGTQRLTVPRNLVTTKPFKLRCAGRGDSKIIVDTGSANLLTITQRTVGAQVAIEGCEFQAAAPGVATPIVVKYAGTAAGPSLFYQYSSLTIRDVSFVGLGNTDTAGVNYFLNGAEIFNAWQPIISGFHFTGAVGSRRAAQNGLIFHYSFAAQVHDYFAQYAVRGIYDPGDATNGQNSEGLAVHSGEIVDVDYGMELIGTDADPGLIVGPVHINAGKSCIRTVYKSQFDIGRVLCYKLAGDANDFNGFDISNAAYGNISSVQIGDSRSSNTGGAFTGIKLTNSFGVTVNGVQAQNWQNTANSLLYLAGTTNGTRISNLDASLVPGLTAIGFDPSIGTNNLFTNVLPAVVQGLAINSATPSVGNDRSGMWTTANTAATSITNLTNGVPGQRIVVFFTDATTTVVHGGPIRLKGATNASPPAGGTITLQYFGAYWVELSRSF